MKEKEKKMKKKERKPGIAQDLTIQMTEKNSVTN